MSIASAAPEAASPSLASVLSRGGKWTAVFNFSAAICMIAAILARFVLKPRRDRYLKLPAPAMAPVAGDD